MTERIIDCKYALNRIKNNRLPFKRDLNIFRWCQHWCKYCYAIYTHKYLNNSNFFEDINIKDNIIDNLDKQLSKKSWKKEIINIWWITDSYQPIEKKYWLMKDILKIMIKHSNPIIISTKSDLILRDMELIEKLAQKTYVNIAFTITTCDESIRKHIEPHGATTQNRFNALKEIKKTKAVTGVHLMPILPYITDSEINIDEIFLKSKHLDIDYLITWILYLRWKTKNYYLDFIYNNFPNLASKYKDLYQKWSANIEYKSNTHQIIKKIRNKYWVNNNYSKFIPKFKSIQPSLFD